MTTEYDVAEAVLNGIRPLVRRIRQLRSDDELTQPERSALARLEQCGPSTAAELARHEQVRPQSMGPTVASLEEAGLVARGADPDDGRRVVLTITDAGTAVLRERRHARAQRLAEVLGEAFDADERAALAAAAPLLERLARAL